jgi:ribonuclease E
MLVNATQQEELRVALVDGQKLYDLSIEIPSREQKKANIYKARISRVEPSLEAAFVDYGAQRHGFLPLKEISRDYFRNQPQGRLNIRELITEGQELLVQVEKEERGNKGAALTTFISLAGRFLVLMPNNPRRRRLAPHRGRGTRSDARDNEPAAGPRRHGRDRAHRRRRTHGRGAAVGSGQPAHPVGCDRGGRPHPRRPFLVYQESDAVTRSLRDYLTDDIGEILVDDDSAFAEGAGVHAALHAQ